MSVAFVERGPHIYHALVGERDLGLVVYRGQRLFITQHGAGGEIYNWFEIHAPDGTSWGDLSPNPAGWTWNDLAVSEDERFGVVGGVGLTVGRLQPDVSCFTKILFEDRIGLPEFTRIWCEQGSCFRVSAQRTSPGYNHDVHYEYRFDASSSKLTKIGVWRAEPVQDRLLGSFMGKRVKDVRIRSNGSLEFLVGDAEQRVSVRGPILMVEDASGEHLRGDLRDGKFRSVVRSAIERLGTLDDVVICVDPGSPWSPPRFWLSLRCSDSGNTVGTKEHRWEIRGDDTSKWRIETPEGRMEGTVYAPAQYASFEGLAWLRSRWSVGPGGEVQHARRPRLAVAKASDPDQRASIQAVALQVVIGKGGLCLGLAGDRRVLLGYEDQPGRWQQDKDARLGFQPMEEGWEAPEKVTQIVVGQLHGLILTARGSVYGVGYSGYGKRGSASGAGQPSLIPRLPAVEQMTAEIGSSFLLTRDGRVLAAGNNIWCCLGIPHADRVDHFKQLRSLPRIRLLTGRQTALDVEGRLWGWGDAPELDEGDQMVTGRKAIVFEIVDEARGRRWLAPRLPKLTQVVWGHMSTTLAITASGEAIGWGYKEHAPGDIEIFEPELLAIPHPVRLVRGNDCGLVQTAEGSIYRWRAGEPVRQMDLAPHVIQVMLHPASGGISDTKMLERFLAAHSLQGGVDETRHL